MQDPARDISAVVSSLTSSPTPDIQRAAVIKYFTEDAGFRNPFYFIKPGILSREDVLGVYQLYRVLSPNAEPVHIENVVHDQSQGILILDIQHSFHIRLSPLKPVPARLLTRLKLSRKDGLYYICFQEDFFHPDEIFNMLVPPVVPVIRFFLSTTGVVSTLLAKAAQVLGFWRADKGGIEDILPTSEQQIPPVSDTLVGSKESFVKHSGHDFKLKASDVKDEVQKVAHPQPSDPIHGDHAKGVGERTQRLAKVEEHSRKNQKGSSQHTHVPRQSRP